MKRSLALFLLVAASAAGQNADLKLSATAAPTFNAGELATITARVTNLGPDTAEAAGVRLPKLKILPVPVERFGCLDLPDSVLCNVARLAPGESHDLSVPFLVPDNAGPMTLVPRTFTRDPNHTNDSVTLHANVVSMADLVTIVFLDPSLQFGKVSHFSISVLNYAARSAAAVMLRVTIPDTLQVVSAPANCRGNGDGTYTCTMGDIPGHGQGFVSMSVRPQPDAPEEVTLTASAESATDEWSPADNSMSTVQRIYSLPTPQFSLAAPDQLDENNRATLTLTVTNPDAVSAVNPKLQIGLSYLAVTSWDAPGWSCFPDDANDLLCTAASIAPNTSTSIRIDVRAPLHELRVPIYVQLKQVPDPTFRSDAQIFAPDIVFYRTFAVTTVADGGPGSLRQMIDDVNAQCSAAQNAPPCRITFAIPAPVPAEGWFTIEPLSPLPTITAADFAIDGETQTALTGDTNPAGPEIFLLGHHAGESEGLRMWCGVAEVRGLAIGGFELNGVMLFRRLDAYIPTANPSMAIERNYLGVDPTGARAAANGLRGIMTYNVRGTIARNVISGNRRSGIWLTHGGSMSVVNNRIGIAANTDDPFPNGASGFFCFACGDTTLQDNVIAFNREYGVSTKDCSVSLFQNVIAGNSIASDLGLNGPDPAPTKPNFTSARYSGGNTIIEGIALKTGIVNGYPHTATVYLYANSSSEEGAEQFLGTADTDAEGHFSLTIGRDLRGKYIDGTSYTTTDFGDLLLRGSSEFGRPIRVTE